MLHFNDLSAWVGCWISVFYKEGYLHFYECSFGYRVFVVSGKVWIP